MLRVLSVFGCDEVEGLRVKYIIVCVPGRGSLCLVLGSEKGTVSHTQCDCSS